MTKCELDFEGVLNKETAHTASSIGVFAAALQEAIQIP